MDRPRRRFLRACGATVLGLAGCMGGPNGPGTETPDGQDTTTVGSPTDTLSGTPPGSREPSPAEPPDDDGTPRGPGRTRWQVPTDATPQRPLVVDGTCYLGTGDVQEAGRAELLAVEADGTVRWRREVGQAAAEVIAVADGTVYAITGDSTDDMLHGEDFQVRAHDAASGERRWRWAPEKHYKFFEPVGVRDGTVFVGTHDDALGGSGEEVLAVADGSARWARETGDVMGGAVVGDTVVADATAGIAAFAAADGTRRWTHEAADPGSLNPEGFGDLVLAGDGAVTAFDAADGSEVWSVTDWTVTTWHVDGERAYLGGQRVAAVDRTGTARWTYDAGGRPSAVGTDRWLVGAARGELFVLERATGDERWRTAVDTEFPSPGGIADGRLAYGTRERGIVVVTADTGEEVWSWSTAGGLAAPVAAGDAFVVGREGGGLWALRP